MSRTWKYDPVTRIAGWQIDGDQSWREVVTLQGEKVLVPKNIEMHCDGAGWKRTGPGNSIVPCDAKECAHKHAFKG